MKILLLGGNGFIGRHLAYNLCADHDVTVFDIDTSRLNRKYTGKKITGDIRVYDAEPMIEECDLVVDLIAYANPKLYVDHPIDTFDICFTENLKIVKQCVKHRKKIIQFSTSEVYGDHGSFFEPWREDSTNFITGPINEHRWIYANGKQTLERLIHIYGQFHDLKYTIIRPFNFIGHDIDYMPSEQQGCPRVFSHFVDSIRGNGDMKLVNGGLQRRAYTYIDDAIECVRLIIDNPQKSDNHIFNIGSPENETTIKNLSDMMITIARDENWIKTAPKVYTVTGKDFYGPGYADITRRIPDITKAISLLGWKPSTDLRTTLYKSMLPWFTS